MIIKYIANTTKLVVAKIEVLSITNGFVYFRSIIDENTYNPCIIHAPIDKFHSCTFDTLNECLGYMGSFIYNKYKKIDFTKNNHITSVDGFAVDLDLDVVRHWIEIGKELFPEKFI